MTGKTITIDQSELLRILAALRSVTTDLRDLMDNGFPKPPRRKNADAGSAYEQWWDDKRVALEVAGEVLRDTEGLC